MAKRGIKLQFPEYSLLLTGGGWKSHTGETVTFEQYADLVFMFLESSKTEFAISTVWLSIAYLIRVAPYILCEFLYLLGESVVLSNFSVHILFGHGKQY